MSNLNLMIGDFIKGKGNEATFKVREIFVEGISTTMKYMDKYVFIDNDNIQPIPLSPEVMEKIENISKNENRGTRYGFLDGYYNIDRDTDLVAIFEDDGLLYIYTYEYSHEQFQLVCTFQYLHQLQQLIRLFTGKEIEVK